MHGACSVLNIATVLHVHELQQLDSTKHACGNHGNQHTRGSGEHDNAHKPHSVILEPVAKGTQGRQNEAAEYRGASPHNHATHPLSMFIPNNDPTRAPNASAMEMRVNHSSMRCRRLRATSSIIVDSLHQATARVMDAARKGI